MDEFLKALTQYLNDEFIGEKLAVTDVQYEVLSRAVTFAAEYIDAASAVYMTGVRLHFPGTPATRDYRTDRVTVTVQYVLDASATVEIANIWIG